MFDEDFGMHLIEVNTSPSLSIDEVVPDDGGECDCNEYPGPHRHHMGAVDWKVKQKAVGGYMRLLRWLRPSGAFADREMTFFPPPAAANGGGGSSSPSPKNSPGGADGGRSSPTSEEMKEPSPAEERKSPGDVPPMIAPRTRSSRGGTTCESGPSESDYAKELEKAKHDRREQRLDALDHFPMHEHDSVGRQKPRRVPYQEISLNKDLYRVLMKLVHVYNHIFNGHISALTLRRVFRPFLCMPHFTNGDLDVILLKKKPQHLFTMSGCLAPARMEVLELCPILVDVAKKAGLPNVEALMDRVIELDRQGAILSSTKRETKAAHSSKKGRAVFQEDGKEVV